MRANARSFQTIKEKKTPVASLIFAGIFLVFFMGFASEIAEKFNIPVQIFEILFSVIVVFECLVFKFKPSSGVVSELSIFTFWSLIMFFGYNYYSLSTGTRTSFYGIILTGSAAFFLSLFFIILGGLLYCDSSLMRLEATKKWLDVLLVSSILVNFVFLIRATSIYPNAIRAPKTAEYLGYGSILFAIPRYAIIYGLAILFPILLENVRRQKGKQKLFWIAIVLIAGYSIIVSNFTTAAIAMLFSAIIYYVNRIKGAIKYVLIFFIFAFAVIMLATDVLGIFLNYLSVLFSQSETWSGKLLDMANSLLYGDAEGSIYGRSELYKMSWDCFKSNPLIGNLSGNVKNIGGHSTFLDILGTAGLIGGGAFVAFLISSYKYCCKLSFGDKQLKNIIMSCYVAFILIVTTKNIITSFCICISIFVVLPLYITLIKKEDMKNDFR